MANNTRNDKHNAAFRPFGREGVTLVIEPHAAFNDGDNPLSAAHESFSRFSFALLKDGKAHVMNMRWMSDDGSTAITPNNYLAFKEMFEMVKGEHLKKLLEKNTSSSNNSNSLATTLVFKNGKYTKGKTAAQVLKDDAVNGKKYLWQQRDWLLDNLDRYPGNEEFINAIDEALSLSADELQQANGTSSYVLYSSGYRLLSKTNNKGKRFTYIGEINFYPGLDYPTEVKISNCFCETKKQGELEFPLIKTAEQGSTASISLSWNETLRMINEFNIYLEIKNSELYRQGIEISECKDIFNGVDRTEESVNTDNDSKGSNKANKQSDNANICNDASNAEKEAKSAKSEATGSTDNDNTSSNSDNTNDVLDGVFYNIKEFVPFKNMYCTTLAKLPLGELTDNTVRFNCIFPADMIEKLGKSNFEGMVEMCNNDLMSGESCRFPIKYILRNEKVQGKETCIMYVRGLTSPS